MASALGAKRAEMADGPVAERATGYVLGGISPIGQKRRLATVVDESAQSWGTIFVSGGRRGFEIELVPADLVAVTSARLAPIARPRENR
jgi:Cys-tRNA(Pro)/Cys-tRNA(Cys) deacylase